MNVQLHVAPIEVLMRVGGCRSYHPSILPCKKQRKIVHSLLTVDLTRNIRLNFKFCVCSFSIFSRLTCCVSYQLHQMPGSSFIRKCSSRSENEAESRIHFLHKNCMSFLFSTIYIDRAAKWNRFIYFSLVCHMRIFLGRPMICDSVSIHDIHEHIVHSTYTTADHDHWT